MCVLRHDARSADMSSTLSSDAPNEVRHRRKHVPRAAKLRRSNTEECGSVQRASSPITVSFRTELIAQLRARQAMHRSRSRPLSATRRLRFVDSPFRRQAARSAGSGQRAKCRTGRTARADHPTRVICQRGSTGRHSEQVRCRRQFLCRRRAVPRHVVETDLCLDRGVCGPPDLRPPPPSSSFLLPSVLPSVAAGQSPVTGSSFLRSLVSLGSSFLLLPSVLLPSSLPSVVLPSFRPAVTDCRPSPWFSVPPERQFRQLPDCRPSV